MTDEIVRLDDRVALQTRTREELTHDFAVTDEQFLDECYQFQGSAATRNDYASRRQFRALYAWAKLHDIDPDVIRIYGRCQLHNLSHEMKTGTFGPNGIAHADEAIRMIREEERNQVSTCTKCGRYDRIQDPPAWVLTLNRHWCSACCEEWLATPSSPPAGGIRSALGRARAAHLPATLTEAEWQSALGYFNDRCAFCGGPWCLVEHATSIAVGGGTTITNCLPACIPCNTAKRDRDLEALDGQWAEDKLASIWAWLETNGRPARTKRSRRRGQHRRNEHG